MAKKKPKSPPRPRTRRWFPPQGQKWLKLEPARLAPIGGLFFATCTMLLYLIRLLSGHEIAPQTVLVGIASTFLVSYAGTGFFVWYLLRTAENELDKPAAKSAPERGHDAAAAHEKSHHDGTEAVKIEENP